MAEFAVHFEGMAGVTVRVEAEDYDEAIDKAYEGLPGGLCANCSGWDRPWSQEMPENPEPYSVWSGDKEVWNSEGGGV